jgi:hypothetical protein
MLYFSSLEDFLPDLEILKPPDEPGPLGRALFIRHSPNSADLLDFTAISVWMQRGDRRR